VLLKKTLAIAPFALDVVLLADFLGAEFAILFQFTILKKILYPFERWLEFKRSVIAGCKLLAENYFFRPRIMASHLAASSLLLVLTSSLLLSCLMWLPPLYLSSGLLS